MRYEIIEVGQECGEVEYQVSDVHPNGERTHSYDFMTLAEAEECLDELNTINNNNNGEINMNFMTKICLIIAIVAGSMFITSTAQANACMYNPMASCGGVDLDNRPAPAPETEEEKPKGVSAQHDAEVAARNEALVKKHKESGNKDIDEIFGWSTAEKERDAGKCFKKTWYGKKEITCEK